ncbi:MAG: ribulose-phosphate 3-epimerase [Flexilinea sp.]
MITKMSDIDKSISPSMICMDLCNLEQSVHSIEEVGCKMLHIDILDGYFSPSMPIGLDIVSQLRKKTNLFFDVHLMTMDSTFFMEQLVEEIGIQQLCFQVEVERHIGQKLSYLKGNNISAGVALSPATPISILEYALELCDFVLLMLINPGYASHKDEKRVEGVERKIGDLRKMIDKKGLSTTITVDGRTYIDDVPDLIAAGADTIVAGTSSLFKSSGTLKENFDFLRSQVAKGNAIRNNGKN